MCMLEVTMHKADGSGDKKYTTEFTGMKEDNGKMEVDKKALKKTMKAVRKHIEADYKQPLV